MAGDGKGVNNLGKTLSVIALAGALAGTPDTIAAQEIRSAQEGVKAETTRALTKVQLNDLKGKTQNNENAFDEANFKLDLKEYLGNESKEFDEMQKDKKNIFANTLTQLLRDNGKSYEKTFVTSGNKRSVDTLKDIRFLMRDYVRFLHNIDFKVRDAVPTYKILLIRFEDYKIGGLKIDKSIMYTIYGMKIFAEQVDFFRNEIDKKPGIPSEKYSKQSESLKKRIAELEQLTAKSEQLTVELEKLKAELEVLKIVTKGLEAMSRIK